MDEASGDVLARRWLPQGIDLVEAVATVLAHFRAHQEDDADRRWYVGIW